MLLMKTVWYYTYLTTALRLGESEFCLGVLVPDTFELVDTVELRPVCLSCEVSPLAVLGLISIFM